MFLWELSDSFILCSRGRRRSEGTRKGGRQSSWFDVMLRSFPHVDEQKEQKRAHKELNRSVSFHTSAQTGSAHAKFCPSEVNSFLLSCDFAAGSAHVEDVVRCTPTLPTGRDFACTLGSGQTGERIEMSEHHRESSATTTDMRCMTGQESGMALLLDMLQVAGLRRPCWWIFLVS